MKKVKTYLVIAIIAIMLLPITCIATNVQENTIGYNETDLILTKSNDEENDIQSDGGLIDAELYNNEIADYESMGIEPIDAELYDDIMEDYYNDQYLESEIYDDVYEYSSDITLTKSVLGNVYLMGNNVTISSDYIHGSVFICANKITIENTDISGSLFLAGETINVNCFATDVYAAGSKVYLGENAEIYRDIRIAGSKVDIRGYISRNAYIGVDNLTISDNAMINGNLEYSSEKEANIPAGVVYGDTNFIKTEPYSATYERNIVKEYATSLFSKLISTLLIALLVILCAPKFITSKKEENIVVRFLISLGIGTLVLIFVPVISIILLMTILCAPVSVLLIAIYILLLLVAFSATSIGISKHILNKMKPESNSKLHFLGITALVTIAMWIVTKLPYIGFTASCIFGLTGIGLIISHIFKKDKVIEENV